MPRFGCIPPIFSPRKRASSHAAKESNSTGKGRQSARLLACFGLKSRKSSRASKTDSDAESLEFFSPHSSSSDSDAESLEFPSPRHPGKYVHLTNGLPVEILDSSDDESESVTTGSAYVTAANTPHNSVKA